MDERAQNERGGLTLDAGAIRMLWFGMLVYLDFTTTLMLIDDVTAGVKQAVMIKSIVLIGACMAVMAVRFPGGGSDTEGQETA